MASSILRSSALDPRSPIQGALLRQLGKTGELSIPALRALSPLSDKAQILVDTAVVEVGLERLQFTADLLEENLTYTLSDPLSVTLLEWESINKVGGAQRSMTPSARNESLLTDRILERLPIYVTTDDFSINIRTMKMSERVGIPLDTTLIKQAVRRVNEALEDASINGATTLDGQPLAVGSQGGQYTAPGLLNAPNANQITLASNWANQTNLGNFTAGGLIFQDVEAMIVQNQNAHKYGPYGLYIPTVYGNAIDNDFKQYSSDTIRQRLSAIPSLKKITVVDHMPYTVGGLKQVALVQLTDDVVQVVNGQPPTVIPWTSLDGFTLHWLVMAIMVPRVRSDYNGQSGICIGSTTAS
jgi:hypothetical protein